MNNKKAVVIGTLPVLLVGAVAVLARQRNVTVKGSDTLVIPG